MSALPSRLAGLALTALALALCGCRFNVQHAKDGTPPDPEKLADFKVGASTLDDALAAFGAPDGIAWTVSEDALIYDSSTLRSSRWVVDNPMQYMSMVTPVGAAKVLVQYAVATAVGQSGGPLPTRPQVSGAPSPASSIARPGGPGNPLTLSGDATGTDELRLFFDRDNQTLVRVEVAHNTPGGGVGGIARSTFLH
jgi:hypothetical protein